MNNRKSIVWGSLAAASLVAGGAGAALASAAQTGTDAILSPAAAVEAVESASFSPVVKADAAQGTFSWTQDAVTPNAVIASTFRPAVATLCNSTVGLTQTNPLEWKISVGGDVENAFTATVDELAAADSVSQTMTCSCGSNPADGRAIVSADVKGIPVTYLIEQARPASGANTVTFVCSDGTEQAFPLGYVIGRHAVISYEVNDEDLSASVGGNNQLWMTRTPANYFVRDVVEIRVSTEAQPPANPGEGMEYPNSPNVGILAASIR